VHLWGTSGGFSLAEPPAEALDEPGVVRGGRLEQPLVLVVGLAGVEQAGAVPGLDRAGVHAEVRGDPVECQ
jgi:hypothetical protein